MAHQATRSSEPSHRRRLPIWRHGKRFEPASQSVVQPQSNSLRMPGQSKRSTLVGLATIAAFALSYLQIATVSWYVTPAHDRVNNGSQPTFFAFHIEPYGVTSEDFHLYAVRAKRILDRGWTDSPLNSNWAIGHNFAAPLQALLGMIAVQTDGRPFAYSVFMSCVFLFGWGILFLAARRFLPDNVPTSTIVLAVLTAVLFEAAQYLFITPAESTSFPWPLHRHMRMSTLSWTTPLALAAILASTSLWFRNRQLDQKPRSTVWLVGILLLVLTCADNWAFGLAWMAATLVLGTIILNAVVARIRSQPPPANSWSVRLRLAPVLALTFALNRFVNGGLTADALLRSGMGRAWLNSYKDGNLLVHIFENWFYPAGLLTLTLIILPPLYARLAMNSRRENAADSQSVADRPPWFTIVSRWQYAAFALASVSAMLTMLILLSHGGLEPYSRQQLYWRVDLILLFSLVLTVAEALRVGLIALGQRWRRVPIAWTAIAVTMLVALFAYHQYRIHWFVKHTVATEYFLTADAEGVRPWLETFDRQHRNRYTLATLSPELNYLCAYWTDADLLLPSGFPYHNLCSNRRIHEATLDLFSLYQVSPEAWLEFTTPSKFHFYDRWKVSRVEAAGLSYLYQVFHRAFALDSASHKRWRYAEREAIAEALEEPKVLASALPDLLVVDDVSRALGQPNLDGYELGIHSGSIEVWVRR